MATIIEVDSRKRVSIGQVGALAERYLMNEDADGTITLEPAVVLTTTELRLLQRPDITTAIEKARDEIDAGLVDGKDKPVRRRS